MPSPFPGMDPYLEDPLLWPSVHHLLVSQIGATLNRGLPAGYVASFGERVFVAGPDRDIYPDVLLKHDLRDGGWDPTSKGEVVAVSDPPWVVAVESGEIIEGFVEIRSLAENQRVVTTIEVLSPRNKTPGSEGRLLYRRKQREVLASDVHLLEIDLLRSGEHTVAAPRESLLGHGVYHYLVSLSRDKRRFECEVWGIPLASPLPRIRVPLNDPDPDVVLDLQAVFTRAYEDGAFGRVLDYTQSPKVPLAQADAEWAQDRLRSAGRRP